MVAGRARSKPAPSIGPLAEGRPSHVTHPTSASRWCSFPTPVARTFTDPMERLEALARHVGKGAESAGSSLLRVETSSVRTLPRFDSYVLGHYIDDLYEFKQSVYEEFRSRPDLLPPVIEGLTKGILK